MGSYTDGAQYDFKEIIFYRQILALVASLMNPSLDQVAHAGGWPASPSVNKRRRFYSSPLKHHDVTRSVATVPSV
jgi:hypothetical protein